MVYRDKPVSRKHYATVDDSRNQHFTCERGKTENMTHKSEALQNMQFLAFPQSGFQGTVIFSTANKPQAILLFTRSTISLARLKAFSAIWASYTSFGILGKHKLSG